MVLEEARRVLGPWFTKKKVNHGNGKVVVWGIRQPQQGAILWDIAEHLLGTYQDLGLDHHDHYFQQDNDPKHTSKLVQAWFHENHVNLLPWLPNSPDLNIIENLCDHLDCWVQAHWNRGSLPQSVVTCTVDTCTTYCRYIPQPPSTQSAIH